MIQSPQQRQDSQKKIRSPIASLVLFFSGIGFFFLMFMFIGPAIMIVAAVFAFAAIHYLLWGKWLSKSFGQQPEKLVDATGNDKPPGDIS